MISRSLTFANPDLSRIVEVMPSGPTRIAQLVAKLVDQKLRGQVRARGLPGRRTLEVFQAFERIGPPLTDHAEPSAFRQGRLTIKVRNSAWLTELSMMRLHLIRRLNGSLARPLVEDVRFVLGNPKPLVAQPSRRALALSVAQRAMVSEWASGLSNERVKEAFERAAETSLTRGPVAWQPFVGPPGPRVTPIPPWLEDGLEQEEPELTYGYGRRTVDRWKMTTLSDDE